MEFVGKAQKECRRLMVVEDVERPDGFEK